MINIGIDLGCSEVKGTNQTSDVCFDSIVGYNFDSMMTFGYNASRLAFESPKVCCGDTAIRYAANIVRHKDDRWLSSDSAKFLFQMALSELVADNANVSAVIAVPINLYKCQKGILLKNIAGVNSFQREMREKQSIFVSAHEIPQAFAALCNEILNEKGEITSDLALKRVGCIDIGGRNTNILLSDEMRDVAHASDCINIGCWTIVEQLKDIIVKEFDRPSITESEVKKALKTRELNHEGKIISINNIITEVIRNINDAIISNVDKIWDDAASIDQILVLGGGSYYFGNQLLTRYPQARIIKNPIMANAYGACKYSKLIGRLS